MRLFSFSVKNFLMFSPRDLCILKVRSCAGGIFMSREGRLFSNTLLLGGGAALCKLLSMLLLPLYTAALTPAEFGTVEIFVTTAVLLIPVASCYAPQALFRFVAQGEEGSVFVGGILMLFGFLFTLFLKKFATNKSSARNTCKDCNNGYNYN